MRLRRRGNDTAPLSPYADDFVTARERGLLGDWEANRLAFERRLAESRRRPPFVIDYDTDVTDERPEATGSTPLTPPEDTTALDVLASRQALLDGDHLPWLTMGETR